MSGNTDCGRENFNISPQCYGSIKKGVKKRRIKELEAEVAKLRLELDQMKEEKYIWIQYEPNPWIKYPMQPNSAEPWPPPWMPTYWCDAITTNSVNDTVTHTKVPITNTAQVI